MQDKRRFLVTAARGSTVGATDIESTLLDDIMIASGDLLSFLFDDHQEQSEHRLIYVDGESPSHGLSRVQVQDCVRRLIYGLKEAGLRTGDCVDIHLFNNIFYSCYVLAIIGAGGIWAGSTPSYTPRELVHHFEITNTKFIVTTPDLVSRVEKAATKSSISDEHIILHDSLAFGYWPSGSGIAPLPQSTIRTHTPVHRLISQGESDWIRFSSTSLASKTTAIYLSTSGTTGLPKAAAFSHSALIAEATSVQQNSSTTYEVSRLIFTPAFHSYSTAFLHFEPISSGRTVYILPRFNLDNFLEIIERFQITETAQVPAVIQLLLGSRIDAKRLDSLKRIYSAGDALSPAHQQQFQALLRPTTMLDQFLGTTESGRVTKNVWPNSNPVGSVGRAQTGVKLKIVGSNDSEICEDNVPGELAIRSGGVMMGYSNKPEATANAFTADGWLRTGDIVCRRNEYIYVVGRAKELIKVRAWQVSPCELEATLMAHPGIEDAAVVGVPSRDGASQVPRAYAVRGIRGKRLREEDVYAFGRKEHAGYKALKGGVVFVKQIPKTASGKKMRWKLTQVQAGGRKLRSHTYPASISTSLIY